MLFLCYPKCSTCQKAKAWLEERGISYDLRDIKQNNPTVEELTAWYRKSGLPLKKFFNTSGLQYKALGLKDKLTAMSEDEQLALLATDGMLVKRPEVLDDIGEDEVIGFPDIIERQRCRGRRVSAYTVGEEDWLDMGQLDELEKMRERLYGKP